MQTDSNIQNFFHMLPPVPGKKHTGNFGWTRTFFSATLAGDGQDCFRYKIWLLHKGFNELRQRLLISSYVIIQYTNFVSFNL